MNQEKVYVAIHQRWEDATIMGIYLTRKEAVDHCLSVYRVDSSRTCVVEEWEIGKRPLISRTVIHEPED